VKTAYKRSFLSDIRRVNDPGIKRRLEEVIEQVERAEGLIELNHLKKLQGTHGSYRIRLRDYRVGLLLKRCLGVRAISASPRHLPPLPLS